MQILVSKNSILRFKLGRKIVKAKKGDIIVYNGEEYEDLGNGTMVMRSGKLLSPIRIPLNTILNTTTRLLAVALGRFNRNYPYSKSTSGYEKSSPQFPAIILDARFGDFINGWDDGVSGLVSDLYNNNLGYLSPKVSVPYIPSDKKKLRLARIDKLLSTGKWMIDKNGNLVKKSINPRNNKSKSTVGTTTPRFLSRYSRRMSEIGGVNNIRAWLEKLKNYYDAGTYNPDSIWGANTEKAYLKYLAELNNNLGLVKLEPVSISPTKESVLQNDFVQDKQTGYPSIETIRSSSPILNLQNNFASQKSSGYQSGLSRGAQLFSNITLRPEFKTPYNFNFNFRNVPRLSYYAKQGSKLVYKNPVKRFKSNFK